MNLFQDLEKGARARKLEFVIIGGFAVIKHGYPRTTLDLDLLCRRQAKEEWDALMVEVGYKCVNDKEVFRQYSLREGTGWPVDLMLVNDVTFGGIFAAARSVVLHGTDLRLVSLEHLFALKLHALKHSHLARFLKDFEDVIQLVRVNHIDLHSASFRALFLKYGSAELYAKICRACEAGSQ